MTVPFDAPDGDALEQGAVAHLTDETDPEADDADRAEQAAATMAIADDMPTPLPDAALDSANDADVAEQSIPVPLDEDDDYR